MSYINGALCFIISVLVCAICAVGSSDVIELEQYSINHISVSGLSSGAYFAVQYHISHSAYVNGSGIFAGGPFYCAESNLEYAEHKCMDTTLGPPEVEKLIALTRTDHTLGFVDNPDRNLKNDNIYLFSGNLDTVVDQRVVKALEQYYLAFSNNVVADYHVDAEHCIPTINYGENCNTLSSPYIGKCNFDGTKAALETIYGKSLSQGKAIPENLFKFNQKPYYFSQYTAIGDIGYIYIPTACQSKGTDCALHISFHGCQQNLELIGPEYATHAGFNQWAEANNIIVVYPYVTVSKTTPYNPKGCWDWWAYTGVYYGTKEGPQVQFVHKIVERITGGV
jgi:hypothetical protein